MAAARVPPGPTGARGRRPPGLPSAARAALQPPRFPAEAPEALRPAAVPHRMPPGAAASPPPPDRGPGPGRAAASAPREQRGAGYPRRAGLSGRREGRCPEQRQGRSGGAQTPPPRGEGARGCRLRAPGVRAAPGSPHPGALREGPPPPPEEARPRPRRARAPPRTLRPRPWERVPVASPRTPPRPRPVPGPDWARSSDGTALSGRWALGHFRHLRARRSLPRPQPRSCAWVFVLSDLFPTRISLFPLVSRPGSRASRVSYGQGAVFELPPSAPGRRSAAMKGHSCGMG